MGIIFVIVVTMGLGLFYGDLAESYGQDGFECDAQGGCDFDNITGGGMSVTDNAFFMEAKKIEDQYNSAESNPSNFLMTGYYGTIKFVGQSIGVVKNAWFGDGGFLTTIGIPSALVSIIGLAFTLMITLVVLGAILNRVFL